MKKLMTAFCFLSSYFYISAIMEEHKGYSYDDVLLIPQYSEVDSRKNTSTKTRLTRNISLHLPFVSANMDTVTEAEMAIAMAQEGGIGIIHRFNSIDQQVEIVTRVKRKRNAVVAHPFTIDVSSTLGIAKAKMEEAHIKSLLIINAQKQLVGILTNRDIKFETDDTIPVMYLMTPLDKMIVGDKNTTVEEAKILLAKHRIEKLPLINPDKTIAGLITATDIFKSKQYPFSSIDKQGRFLVGAAIGTRSDALERAKKLIEAGADVLVIDIAHGHSLQTIETLKAIKKDFPTIEIIAGNVATPEGTKALIQAGADAVKVGVGPGSICTTRIVTGCGYPQFSAVMECALEAEKYGVPIIADGGISVSGSIVKAIGAGASTVMLGSLLAGTDESPGMSFVKNGKKYKIIRGMASFGANLARNEKTTDKNNTQEYVPEGVEALIPYKGSVHEIIHLLSGGLRSGLSYCGVSSLEELRGKGKFVIITTAGRRESHPHDVSELAH